MSVTDWNTGDKSAMLSIGTHKLFLSASGPDRKSGEPVILLMQGLGSTINEWVAVRRLVLPLARWVNYDRSGLGRSEAPPQQPDSISAASVASELDTLLKNAGIEPPFIVVCHSWGGMTAREFLHLRQKDVVGIVFVDANTEKSYDAGNWPLPFVIAVTDGVDWLESTGLEADHVLSDKEWAQVKEAENDPQLQKTVVAEQRGFRSDSAPLASKHQIERQVLGSHPVSVITCNSARDMQRMYESGVAAGKGTEAEREQFRNMLVDHNQRQTDWQQDLLRLSCNSRFIRVDNSGHNVQLVQPAVVAREIRWVWDSVQVLPQ
ncbi:alpha/beta-hydrolase [Mollisia scopiformis]|uniref:Alpha/beta-hydrolase n=1 Tax=Mollisia scopiformis TaxID=149040 RepID=A0A194XL13_MOLSC|nr:alpha/beta-hydrolase [Mollisia scopiformis]KUJ20821.1 alpha/beta-hydrolase [Mollisia scopiformis]